jgi:metal-responsive CopG/Arc/MetJ family transcriptional regulator
MQRFTISLQDELAEQFDTWISQRGYETRSEAVRDMLRADRRFLSSLQVAIIISTRKILLPQGKY